MGSNNDTGAELPPRTLETRDEVRLGCLARDAAANYCITFLEDIRRTAMTTSVVEDPSSPIETRWLVFLPRRDQKHVIILSN